MPDAPTNADITPADIIAAIALWRRYAPVAYRSILTNSKIFEWVAERWQYRIVKTGRYIDSLTLRRLAIDPFLINVKTLIREITSQLQSGAITLTEWQIEMGRLVKLSQIVAALVAVGGVAEQLDSAKVAAEIAATLLLLQKFAVDIQTGKQKTNGRLIARAALYGALARGIYEEVIRGGAMIIGKQYERRVLDSSADHCETHGGLTGCVELAALGWQPIGTLPKLYKTPCRTNCLCHFEYK